MKIQIIDYTPQYQPDFARLNYAWIEKFFKIEAADRAALDFPDEKIISKGGHILLAQADDQTIVGTCALVKMSESGSYELAKMSVADTHQGLGIGKMLGIATIEHAKSMGANRLYIETNSSLHTAINLYEKLGFQKIPKKDTPYQRCDVQFELFL